MPYQKLISSAGTLEVDGRVDVTAGLFNAHRVALVRMAALLVDDRETAQDVVQEAFLQLHAHRRSLSSPDAALPYVRRCVLNGARSVLRRRRLTRRVPVEDPQTRPGVDVAVVSNFEQRAVLAAVRGLPARQQQVVILRFWLDVSVADVADVLGIRPGAVAAATFKAIRTLGRRLSDQGIGKD